MKHAAAVFTFAMFFLALFSAPQMTEAANTTKSQNNSTVEQIWEVAGFSMPESVAISPTDNWIYVSNVNGDKSGYISRLTKDGKIDNLQWVTGLGNPAGLGLYENTLYVGDGTQLHLIDLQQGKLLKSISSTEAKALNDVTIDKSGQVFVSDIATGKIFALEGESLKIWFTAPEIAHPNGLFIQDNHLFVADFASELSHELTPEQYGSLYKVSLFDKSYSRISSATQLGGLDGITSINNGLLVSSNPTGELFAITDKERILVGTFVKGLADISMSGDTLYAPLLFTGKLAAYRLQGTDFTSTTFQKWTHLTTKEDFLAKVADTYFGDEGGQSVAKSDGTIEGDFGGKKLKGTWEWSDTYFCRTSTLGNMDLGHDCIVIDVTDYQIRLTLQKGSGMSVVYDKK